MQVDVQSWTQIGKRFSARRGINAERARGSGLTGQTFVALPNVVAGRDARLVGAVGLDPGRSSSPPLVRANPPFVAIWLLDRTRASSLIMPMQHTALLTVTSLLSIVLLTLHVTDDIVRGISEAEPAKTALLALVILLYGTLVLRERRSGHVIMLLVGLFAAAMPVIHMSGAHYGEIARSAGGFFFVWTLWALGGLGGLTFILSAQGLWTLRRGRPR
jgi:hypothetical protein